MQYVLKNKNLEIHVDTPSEKYSCTRFDWTGKISKVWFQNISLTTLENTDLANTACFGEGLYNEFGIESPLGFNETAIGGWFHKIGVGLLKKEDNQYLFHKKYAVKPAKFAVFSEANKVTITCVSETVNGYSYELTKEIELHPSSFTIKYTLQNTGEKKMVTDEYVHNFLAINQEEIGDSYQLKFLFPLNPRLFGETVNPENKVEIGVEKIEFNDTPKQPFFFSHLNGMTSVTSAWELIHVKSNIGMKEIGSFQTSKVNLWGNQHVISPELFHNISLLPGESKEWSRTYCMTRLD